MLFDVLPAGGFPLTPLLTPLGITELALLGKDFVFSLAWMDLVPTGLVAGGTMIAGQFGWLALFRNSEVLQGPQWKKQQTWLVLP